MKSKWKGALIGGLIGLIIGIYLSYSKISMDFIPGGVLFLFIGLMSGFIIFSNVRRRIILLGGLIGFFIPWIYFIYLTIASGDGHLGMAIPFIFIYSVITCIIGVIISLIGWGIHSLIRKSVRRKKRK